MENTWDYQQNPYQRRRLEASKGLSATDRYIRLLDLCSLILRQADGVISAGTLYTPGREPDEMIAQAERELAPIFSAAKAARQGKAPARPQTRSATWAEVDALRAQVGREHAARRAARR